MTSTNNQVAIFKTSKAFNITGVGQVLTGQIIHGQIKSGNLIKLVIKETSIIYKIDSIEYVDYLSSNEGEIGLIIKPLNCDTNVNFDKVLGQNVSIIDASL